MVRTAGLPKGLGQGHKRTEEADPDQVGEDRTADAKVLRDKKQLACGALVGEGHRGTHVAFRLQRTEAETSDGMTFSPGPTGTSPQCPDVQAVGRKCGTCEEGTRGRPGGAAARAADTLAGVLLL